MLIASVPGELFSIAATVSASPFSLMSTSARFALSEASCSAVAQGPNRRP
jgi:hypothetical protein